MDWNILLSPPVAFFLFILVALLVYGFGALLAPKLKAEGGKLEPYACGEEYMADKESFGYRRFFIAAIFFTMMHVAVLSVATIPAGALAFVGLAYLVTIAVSITILYTEFD
jgi:NADH:ubiquinone oxidoreductase subunit 3 (subunit A)